MSSSTADAVAEAAAWLESHPPAGDKKLWLEALVDSGWAAPSWPKAWYGRGLSSADARATDAVFRSAAGNSLVNEDSASNDSVLGRGLQGWGQDVVNLWAATIASHASDALKEKVLRGLMLGEIAMCLLYSEPSAGSDLAGVRTSAVRDGDEWIVNGQKVWTSGGRHADYAFLIARTDLDQPKHRGLSFFLIPMKQEGIEVRPLRQATGDSRFNEVFLTDARVPNENMLGDLNEGWWVLTSALAYERSAMGATQQRDSSEPLQGAREVGSEAPAPVPDLSLTALAQRRGRNSEPELRQRLMKLHSWRVLNEWNNRRAKAAIEQGTMTPIVSLGKLAMSRMLHFAGRLQADILGAEATLAGSASDDAADATYSMLNAYFTSIGGGTDQIQRNIIGERILGLPKEPEIDKGRSFREVLNANQ
ncbi:MAG: acyl-CoA dehydrogenase family protein [Actinomycetota bacterium]|nr:acyl-CoA dehydrogenase family protein [Actinomycetota bacterium]